MCPVPFAHVRTAGRETSRGSGATDLARAPTSGMGPLAPAIVALARWRAEVACPQAEETCRGPTVPGLPSPWSPRSAVAVPNPRDL